jgi:hypothetical protein
MDKYDVLYEVYHNAIMGVIARKDEMSEKHCLTAVAILLEYLANNVEDAKRAYGYIKLECEIRTILADLEVTTHE